MLKYLYGTVAEWLRSGLQNRVQQFESARYLYKAEHFLRSAPLFKLYVVLQGPRVASEGQADGKMEGKIAREFGVNQRIVTAT